MNKGDVELLSTNLQSTLEAVEESSGITEGSFNVWVNDQDEEVVRSEVKKLPPIWNGRVTMCVDQRVEPKKVLVQSVWFGPGDWLVFDFGDEPV